MKLNSLAFRLFRTAAVWAVLVLPAAGFLIDWVYRQDTYKSFDARLSQLLTLNIAFSTEYEDFDVVDRKEEYVVRGVSYSVRPSVKVVRRKRLIVGTRVYDLPDQGCIRDGCQADRRE